MTDIVKILHQGMKHLFNKKGQGIVEFALILACCVGVVLAARDAGMLDAFSDSFNQGVLASLNVGVDESTSSGNGSASSGGSGGGETGGGGNGNNGNGNNGNSGNGGNGNSGNGDNGNSGVGDSGNGETGGGSSGGGGGWGTLAPKSYYENPASQAERLAQDQKALENLAKHFIGLTRGDVKALLNNKSNDVTADMAENKEVMIGHIVPVPNSNYDDGSPKGMMFKADGALNESQKENIFLWMQGEEVENPVYRDDYMYLVSDYVVSQTWADKAGSNQGNGIRLKLEYDYSGTYAYPENYANLDAVKVVGVQLAIDPKSQNNDDLGLENSSNRYNKQSSRGLEVQVRLDKDENGNDRYLITHKDTGIHANKDTGSGVNGMTNWYGEDFNQQASVQAYIQTGRADYSNGVTKDFERGEIFKFKDNKYYIATKSAENVTIKSSDTQNSLESGIFIKFTGYTYRYYFVNTKSQIDYQNQCNKPIVIPEHGALISFATGEVYVYVGNGKNITFTGIDQNNKDDFIKIRDRSNENNNP